MRSAITVALLLPLLGCGLAETATTAAVAGKTQADQVEQAKAMQQKALDGIAQAQQQADQRLKEAEAR